MAESRHVASWLLESSGDSTRKLNTNTLSQRAIWLGACSFVGLSTFALKFFEYSLGIVGINIIYIPSVLVYGIFGSSESLFGLLLVYALATFLNVALFAIPVLVVRVLFGNGFGATLRSVATVGWLGIYLASLFMFRPNTIP